MLMICGPGIDECRSLGYNNHPWRQRKRSTFKPLEREKDLITLGIYNWCQLAKIGNEWRAVINSESFSKEEEAANMGNIIFQKIFSIYGFQ